MLKCQRGAFDMDEPVPTASVDDEPLCVCGYSKVGLPETDHPCPECGSSKLAVYQSSFSYYGWVMAFAGAWISFVHSVIVLGTLIGSLELPEVIYLGPWLFVSVPLGFFSLICTVISMVKREPRRKSARNVGVALLSGLLFPVGGFILLLIYVALGGMWTV